MSEAGRVLQAVEVRACCEACGSRDLEMIRSDVALGVVTRRCRACGHRKKWLVVYSNEVQVRVKGSEN